MKPTATWILIPGLGTDYRYFANIVDLLPDHQIIRFEIPQRGESIEAYADRLRAQIETKSPIVLGGVSFGGMLASIKFSHTKNSRAGSTVTKYAMWDLEDLDGVVRCILWPEQFAEYGQLVEGDAMLAVIGKIDRRPGAEEVNLIVEKLLPLTELPTRQRSAWERRERSI